jgi:PadR family transcriptional regulator, regulatory protein PadR
MRRTRSLRAVALTLLEQPDGTHFGYDIGKRTGIPSGVLYPILGRLLTEGWITDHWEDLPPLGRPRRRYYQLTDTGKRELAHLANVD